MDFIKLNKKDYELIQILDMHSRMTLNELSKKLNISKQACNKKIKNLLNKKIIKFIPIIDYFKMGYNNVHVYYKLRGLKKDESNNLIKKIRSMNNVAWISGFFGEFNMGISIFYSSLENLQKTMANIDKVFGDHISSKKDHFIIKQFNQSFCTFENNKREIIMIKVNETTIKLSDIERKIIANIRENARYSYLDLVSNQIKKPETIKNNIKKLEKNQIIKGYKLLIDFNKLGYIWSLCHLKLKNNSDSSKLIKLLNKENRIPFISVTLNNNIIIDFLSKNYSELKTYLEELIDSQKIILDYKILNIDKVYKIQEP